ncbi:MAG: HD-GYP domain-containing protein (c-di-GMP phosphodiesterase class II) [Lentisphaeria bacterium]
MENNPNLESNLTPQKTDAKLSVGDLKVGMFITHLDRDWLETPFVIQGFYLYTQNDIELVQKYCRHVYVLGAGKSVLGPQKPTLPLHEIIGRKPVTYVNKTTMQDEMQHAYSISSNVKDHIEKALKDVRFGQALDTKAARVFVDASVKSVLNHTDALLWLTKMRAADEYTTEHCMNVCFLAIAFGRRLGLSKQQLGNLGLCGLLHDVGKMRIPDEILNKPGRLTTEEFEIMKQHSQFGRDVLLANNTTYEGAIEVAFSHHERPDGKGYPRGLAAKDISFFSRIISIVDAYDAITGDRVYAKGRPSTEALRIIYENRGTQFDENLALLFIETIGIYPPGSLVELMDGKVAVVTETNTQYRHLPNILLVLDENKNRCSARPISLELTIRSEISRNYLIKTTLPDGSYGVYLRDHYEGGAI